jgi:5-formyltetrahydrofolate cyclo-ligase
MEPRQELRKRIRAQMRAKRRTLSATDVQRYSNDLARHFEKNRIFQNAQHIAFYFANDGEPDVHPLMQTAWRMRKHCYLPILSPPFQRHLYFAEYNQGDALVLNQFSIPEPHVGPRLRKSGKTMDLVLTPLVAFDRDGNRLGMGGGFYDRTFAYLRHQQHWRRPRMVGVAYDFQQVEQLDSATWDVPLSGIATPSRFIRC